MEPRERLRRGSQFFFPFDSDSNILCRMAIFPRWSGLKHFNAVTTTHFTDGQAFYDILKVCANHYTIHQVIIYMFLVHSAMHRGFPSE
jgi:hypothetical protein